MGVHKLFLRQKHIRYINMPMQFTAVLADTKMISSINLGIRANRLKGRFSMHLQSIYITQTCPCNISRL